MALLSSASIRPERIFVLNLKFVFFVKVATDTTGLAAVSSSGGSCTPCSTESRGAAQVTLELGSILVHTILPQDRKQVIWNRLVLEFAAVTAVVGVDSELITVQHISWECFKAQGK